MDKILVRAHILLMPTWICTLGIIFFTSLTPYVVHCQAEVPLGSNEIFQKALQSYQNKDYGESKKGLEQALAQDPNNPILLYNLALAEQQLSEPGRALAYLERSLYLDPGFAPARNAFHFIQSTFTKKELAHQIVWWEQYRQAVLAKLSIDWLILPTLLLFVYLSYLWIRFFLKRKSWDPESLTPSPRISFGYGLITFLFILLFVLSITKVYDSLETRAIVAVKTIEVKTSPDENQASLFELFEGHEVIVQKLEKDWLLITFPGGLTGWAPKQSLIQTTGKLLW